MIKRNGGELWVESSSGQGTTFKFTLPTGDNFEPRPRLHVESGDGVV